MFTSLYPSLHIIKQPLPFTLLGELLREINREFWGLCCPRRWCLVFPEDPTENQDRTNSERAKWKQLQPQMTTLWLITAIHSQQLHAVHNNLPRVGYHILFGKNIYLSSSIFSNKIKEAVLRSSRLHQTLFAPNNQSMENTAVLFCTGGGRSKEKQKAVLRCNSLLI